MLHIESKKIYLIRHCQAEGQPPEASLTEEGFKQAQYLSDFFTNIKINRIISSPFLRAKQSVEFISKSKNTEIEIDERLSERILSTEELPDWLEKLKATFTDLELKFVGGESSQEAKNRIVSVVDDVLKSEDQSTIIVTHGNIMSLLLENYIMDFGFEDWKNLSIPDVYLLIYVDHKLTTKRLWKEES